MEKRKSAFRAIGGVMALCVGPAGISFAQGGPPPGDPLGPDLMQAIQRSDVAQVRALLSKGAKTENVNWLGVTPLYWASGLGNAAVCDLLIQRGAKVNADTAFGGPLEMAVMSGNPAAVKILLDRGATFSKNRGDKMTGLMMAADGGNIPILKMTLAKRPDVNAADAAGMTALMQASRRGRTEAARLLLNAGANPNCADAAGRTPLMYAALNGYAETAALLLSRGATVNAKDKAGDTALILAARYSGEPKVAAVLTGKGADASIRDARSRTAAEIARSRGHNAFTASVRPQLTLVGATAEKTLSERARNAVQLSLPLLEKTTAEFSDAIPCASCHHQGLGLITTGTAEQYGYRIDQLLALKQRKIVTGDAEAGIKDLQKLIPHPEMYKHFPAMDMKEFSPAVSATLSALHQHNAPRTEATEALATLLARQQETNGSWKFGFHRAPVQSSVFTTTAYSIQAIKAYLPESLAKEREERIARSLVYLRTTAAKNGEDRTFRLLALKWAGAPQGDIDAAAAEIRAVQRPDGGWAQFTGPTPAGEGFTRSDAYATGQALYALYLGANADPATDAAYQRGVEYLLRTQDDDGSWFVNKRALPVNNFLDTGFPHGESQYISYSATCFATMSLIFAGK